MKGSDLAGKQRGAADYSADFEVEDIIPVLRLPKDTTRGAVTGAKPASDAPRWHKKPRPRSNGASDGGAAPAPAAGTGTAVGAATAAPAKAPISDLDPHRLAQRQKQIDYGKNTLGYQRYLELVPKNKRRKKGEIWLDPVTPDIHQEISKRCFDGQVKVWRRALHKYDMQEDEEKVEPISYAERERMHAVAVLGDTVALSAAPSSPTNSSRSRGSLDGYLEPLASEGGRKRPFRRAFDNGATGDSYPSKLLTSPAGPRPAAPQSAPPATAADDRAPPAAGRCVDPPAASGRCALPRSASALNAGAPPAPQTAPPAAVARVTAGSTAAASPRGPPHGSAAAARELRSPRALAGTDELFREWDEEDYAALEPLDDAELEDVQL